MLSRPGNLCLAISAHKLFANHLLCQLSIIALDLELARVAVPVPFSEKPLLAYIPFSPKPQDNGNYICMG